MSESTTGKTSDQKADALVQQENNYEHTCACGEKHAHRPGSPRHRDSCTSSMKFGDSCCCGSSPGPKGNHHRCDHGPKCQ